MPTKTTEARIRRHQRVRKSVVGTPERPRLSVFRSARHISVQAIDDLNQRTLAAASSIEKQLPELPSIDDKDSPGLPSAGKQGVASAVGLLIAQRCKAAGINTVVFDRGGFLYHGRVRALAEGARQGGLEF